MKLFAELFTTEYGWVALAFTLASIALSVAMRIFFVRKMRESERAHTSVPTGHSKD